ncbi:DNA repair protein RecO [Magnetovibrio sp.]|uniref:DNA repair protein RecO n=1 Tax=Magnetovibrio sp. TaxID=2024836 RepID=UPI002F944885
MDWQDDGIVLSARRHGETSAIVTLLTRERGAHAGLVKGGFAKRTRALIEPGNRVRATWRARLSEHLGNFQLESVHSYAAGLLDSPDRLAAMAAALAVSAAALPEREAHPALYEVLGAFLDALEHGDISEHVEGWGSLYVKWELGLLQELGFRLDLDHCAATGVTEDLVWVSPKSARAVSREAGEPYKAQLLPLPAFVRATGGIADTLNEVLQGLKLTGYFLERHIFAPHQKQVPQARARLVERLGAQT